MIVFQQYHTRNTESLQNKTNLLGAHRRALPVVQIVLQVSIADSKLEVFQEAFIFHQIQSVEYIKIVLNLHVK